MTVFCWGALSMGTATAGLFFLRFWRESSDRLFLFFGIAFFMLAVHWLGFALVAPVVESRHHLYLVRLAAFVVILVGIFDKNARARSA
jgi:hypothetical protein